MTVFLILLLIDIPIQSSARSSRLLVIANALQVSILVQQMGVKIVPLLYSQPPAYVTCPPVAVRRLVRI